VRSLQEHAARLRGPGADGRTGAAAVTAGDPRDTGADTGPVQVRGTVLTVRRVDAYHAMTVVAPGIAARFRPGQFVAIAVGGPDSAMLLCVGAFSIH